MSRWTLLAALAGAAGTAPRTQRAEPVLTSIQVAAGDAVTGAMVADVDLDSRLDLVWTGRRSDGRRLVAVHIQQAAGPRAFDQRPSASRILEPDVVAFTFADVDADAAGRELVLLTANQAVAVPRTGEAFDAPRALFECNLLWQPADPERALPWQPGLVDANADGRDDLLLPEPDGYLLALRRGDDDGGFALHRLPLPAAAEDQGPARLSRGDGGLSLQLDLGRGVAGSPLLSRTDILPMAQLRDWDGDGRLDLLALRRPMLHVFPQAADGSFGEASRRSIRVAPTVRTRLFEPGFDVQTVDADGDGQLELVVTQTWSRGGGELESTVTLVAADGAPATTPSLRLRGIAAPPDIADIDGDGRLDLAVGTARVDRIASQISGDEATAELDGQLSVFLNRDGSWRPPAAALLTTKIAARGLADGGRILLRFIDDVDGNGLRDLLLRDADRSLALWLTTRRGGGLQLEQAWRTTLPQDVIVVRAIEIGGRTDALVVAARELSWVSFRR